MTLDDVERLFHTVIHYICFYEAITQILMKIDPQYRR